MITTIVVDVFAGIGLLFTAAVLWALISILIGSISDARKAKRTSIVDQSPPAPVDAIADLLETKAAIRKDELRRWAEAWQRAAQLPDFWAAAREIQSVEFVAVREDRERKRAAEEAARRLAIEERVTARERAAALDQQEREEQLAVAAAHEAHLAARRARYAQRRSNA